MARLKHTDWRLLYPPNTTNSCCFNTLGPPGRWCSVFCAGRLADNFAEDEEGDWQAATGLSAAVQTVLAVTNVEALALAWAVAPASALLSYGWLAAILVAMEAAVVEAT